MTIARVFPSVTRATPIDEMAFNSTPTFFVKADEVHVCVTFSWDIERAEALAKEWEVIAPVKIGGPAMGTRGEQFEPGKYIRKGYVITSRGCPNKCWFCSVPKRDGDIRELEIKDGWNVLDDNLLACSEAHIRSVFSMLKRQPEKAEFTGGLEAKRLKRWHVDLLEDLRPKQCFFAYDTPDDLEPLIEAGKLFQGTKLCSGHTLRCYVLCGWPKDTLDSADKRMRESWQAGFFPMAMVWRDKKGQKSHEWTRFQGAWAQPAVVSRMLKDSTSAHKKLTTIKECLL